MTILFSCGVKPAELLVLSVSCISVEDGIPYLKMGQYQGITEAERRAGATDPHEDATHAWQAQDAGAQREIRVPNWAYRILKAWIELREKDLAPQPTGGGEHIQRLFPGSRKPSPARPNSVMNMATLARTVTQWGKKYAKLSITAQRLRNTFGAQLVEQDVEIEKIEQLMGYAPGAASAFRLKVAWLAFCSKQANLQADEISQQIRQDALY